MRKNVRNILKLMGFFWLLISGTVSAMEMEAEMNDAAEYETTLLSETVEKEVTVHARKRVQWVDESNGDAKITLQYASNSGELSVTQEMNVVLVHDKSGSMDVNYGYHLESITKGWDTPLSMMNYPILNNKNWSETILEAGSTTDLESEGAEAYLKRLNCPNSYTNAAGADSGFAVSGGETSYVKYYFGFNSTCQLDGHYYLLVKDDERSGISAWRMVQGKNLYNVENTDLHHYIMIEAEDGKTARDCAVELIGQGRRVIRMTTDSDCYYSENGETKITENLYFLDVTALEEYDEGWILNSCGQDECLNNSRLVKSQQFMTDLADNILSLNPKNQIAYVPFWGDVPEDGSWKNYKGDTAGTGLEDISHYTSLITSCEDVDSINFTSDVNVLQAQISHPFTYNGTNWSKAFEKTVEYLEQRTAEEKAKETLVLFLTDGMPQGTEGSNTDYQNPSISGIQTDSSGNLNGGAVYQLKNIEGVSVWAVGVGINELDTTGLKDRLSLINDEGQPFYARYTSDFDMLKSDVFTKIENTYVENFYATDAFFQDTLSEYFVLDEAKIEKNWLVFTEEPSTVLVHGVPKNVYEKVCKDGAATGIQCVYVKSTKTFYWYMGTLGIGGYEDAGHALEVPVKFLCYKEDTGGTNRMVPVNLKQSLTYHTTLEPETLYRIDLDTPQLVFNRKDSEITVVKKYSQAKETDHTVYFVYSDIKYTDGVVDRILGSFEIEVLSGKTSGSTILQSLEDGTYYIYETDKNHKIINSQVCEVTVDYQPEIQTKAKAGKIPWAITASDEGTLSNIDNFLMLSSQDMAIFEIGTDLTVMKEIDVGTDGILWEHGNPTFMIRVRGIGTDGKEYSFFHTFEMTKEYVSMYESDGKVVMTHTFYDLPISEKYVVEEVKVSRYELVKIEVCGPDGDLTIIENASEAGMNGFYPVKAEVNLKKNPKGILVKLINKKVNEARFNHITGVINRIK